MSVDPIAEAGRATGRDIKAIVEASGLSERSRTAVYRAVQIFTEMVSGLVEGASPSEAAWIDAVFMEAVEVYIAGSRKLDEGPGEPQA